MRQDNKLKQNEQLNQNNTHGSFPEWDAATTVYDRSELESLEAADKVVVTQVPISRRNSRAAKQSAPTETPSRKNRNKAAATATASAGTARAKTTTKKPQAATGNTPSRKSSPNNNPGNNNTKKKKKKGHPILKAFLLLFICGMLAVGGYAFYYVYSVISKTPPIDPTKIADLLNETSVVYDAQGNEMDAIFYGSNRELTSIQDMPEHLKDAFIAIEDKTFKTHHGFNFRRIIGAILESVTGGGRISGTSTITQQLARNVFLQDTQFEYSMERKIAEAYYSLKIEKALSKDEILEAYLNTIYFGYNSWGIETAAQSYFKKSVSQLTLAESAALAALPQLPDAYQLVNFVEGGTAEQYPDIAIKQTSDGVYVINDMSRERRRLCLGLMLEQELISQADYDAAINVELKDMLNPDFTTYNTGPAIYFADYVISDVIHDLQVEKGMDYYSAWRMVYQGGLKIYSTMDPDIQRVLYEKFADPSNYPTINPLLDYAGNVVTENGTIALWSYDNSFDENGTCYLSSDEYDRLADGRMIIYSGNFLKIYKTDVNGATDYSLELPPMYLYDDNWEYYTIAGGYVNVPMNYKSANSDGDLIISADFFTDYPDFFIFNEDGSCGIPAASYTLGSKTIQPQAAMTLIENSTGRILAMTGGRGASGRQIFNRAISPRQSGSSIKPLSVYSAALQQSADEAASGVGHTFVDYGIDKQGAKLYGGYLTAASIVVDEKTHINGKDWPENVDKKFRGPVTMREALALSLNTCAVKVLYQVGMDYSLQNIKKFGITTLVEEGEVNDYNVAALALGAQANGVTTLEMASAFTTFPNNGVRYEPSPYTKVVDRHGNILLEHNFEPHQVIDPGVAWIMTDMMRDVVTGSPGYIDGAFVAGKTGTTDDAFDIWFTGFTHNYTASLWVGCDVNHAMDATSWNAMAMWANIMRDLDGTYLGERAEMPSNVIRYNGEYFIAGTEKDVKSKKDYEKKIKICKDSGLRATPDCEHTEEKSFMEYDDDDGDGNDDIPEKYCDLHNPDPDKYPTTEEGRKRYEEKKQKEEEEENNAAADPVIALINAIPASPGLSDESTIVAARIAYNALNDQQKAAVGNDLVAKLADAETRLDALKKQAAEDEEAKKREQEAAAREANCLQWWNGERGNHIEEVKRVVAPGQDATYYTQEDYDQYLADNDNNPPPWAIGDVKTPAVEPQFEVTYQYPSPWDEFNYQLLQEQGKCP